MTLILKNGDRAVARLNSLTNISILGFVLVT
jgi:hypothetical protein